MGITLAACLLNARRERQGRLAAQKMTQFGSIWYCKYRKPCILYFVPVR